MEDALAEARALRYTWLAGLILNSLGRCAGQIGDTERALARYREAVVIMAARRDRRVLAMALQGLAGTAATCGRHAEAARLLGAAAGLFERIGMTTESTLVLPEREIVAAREAIGEAPFAAAWAGGRALTLQEAVQEADELAAALFLSKRTVSTHLTNIFGKLGLTNRTEAAAWAVRHGHA